MPKVKVIRPTEEIEKDLTKLEENIQAAASSIKEMKATRRALRKQLELAQAKEAEEKQLRSLGVSESDIETLRVHDWAIFNSDRRYYQRMQETGTYLEEVAADMTQPEIKTVEDFLDNIENQQLYQVLIKADRLTLQAILLQIQGYSIAEIAAVLGMKEDTVYKRLGRLKQKIKKLLG